MNKPKLLLLIIVLVLLMINIYSNFDSITGRFIDEETAEQRIEVSFDNKSVLGNTDARVTIIEFGDYHCTSCARFHEETFPAIKEKYIDTGKAKFIYRNFPCCFFPLPIHIKFLFHLHILYLL